MKITWSSSLALVVLQFGAVQSQPSDARTISELIVADIRQNTVQTVSTSDGKRAGPEFWLDTSRACMATDSTCAGRTSHQTEQAVFAELLGAKRQGTDQSDTADERRVFYGVTFVELSDKHAVVRLKRVRRAQRVESSLMEYRLLRDARGWRIELKKPLYAS